MQFLDRNFNNISPVPPTENIFYASLPYLGHHSVKFKQDLSVLFSKYFNELSFRFVFTNTFTIGSFFNYKDKLPLGMLSSIIYSFSCVRCTSEYVGMTSRPLFIRIAEHAGRSYRTNRAIANPPHSSIRNHTEGTCCSPINIDNFKVLGAASNFKDLRILESLHIFKRQPILNTADSSYPLTFI